MNTNNLVAEVTKILSEVPVDAGQLVQSFPESKVVIVGGGKKLTPREARRVAEEQMRDEWYVKARGINYNFGAVGINVIGEDAE
ncbi:hypothetical protein ACEPPU_24215 [Priestia aryabhattai]|uniref:hypothetical protein n=1 Tax=Priestia aryabhattai TaxID=412384 RepID=UPI0035AB7111